MHNYLRAVGFSNIVSRTDFDNRLEQVLAQVEIHDKIELDEDLTFAELHWECSDNMGIAIRGEYDKNKKFHVEHYYPYCISDIISTNDQVVISKRVDTDAYTGMCDDYRLGVSLIFYLQNSIEYLRYKEKKNTDKQYKVCLSALSVEGKILLPIDKEAITQKYKTLDAKNRNNLIVEARKGNQEAIDSLTIDDIDLYAVVSKRIREEDLYTIVETCFIPYGSESDNYSIIGTIVSSREVENQITKEIVYELEISCNELNFQVCINKEDLVGEPMPGRRFKGNIWMQATIQFDAEE